jgi:ubiquinone/menaquinone biosynthesis C-methylase UbiE
MKGYLARVVPVALKPTLRKLYYCPIDFIDSLRGRDRLTPPKSLIFVGDGDFKHTGQEFRGYFTELAGLQPQDRVLEVGCGIGRMAVPLTDYLAPEGEYWGFDIVRSGIEWCQSRISAAFTNFHFQHIDVYNRNYNWNGKMRAKDLRFPFSDDYFDFVFATSVFTHMLPSGLQNYLAEISRVLKNGGTCFSTFFLLNSESEEFMHAGDSTLNFKYKLPEYRTIDHNNHEAGIAYGEGVVNDLFGRHGLKIIPPIHYGSWCGRDSFLSYQDVVIAKKSTTP